MLAAESTTSRAAARSYQHAQGDCSSIARMERRRSASEQRPAQPDAPCPQRGNGCGDGCKGHARRRPRSVGRSASLRRTQQAASARASLPLPPHLLLVLLLGVCVAIAGADLASMGALPPPQPVQVPAYFINGSHVGFRCAMMHTCLEPGSDEYRGCSCHRSCSRFGTCCAEARPADWRQRAMPTDLYVCASPVPWKINLYDFQPNHTFYTHSMGSVVVNKCPGAGGSDNSSISSYMRALCAHPLQRTGDGVLSALVMANMSQISYRNIFCAFCHGENVSAVTQWTLVNITIPMKYDYGWRGGQVRFGFLAPDVLNVASCRMHMVTGCSDSDADVYREACENEPTAYVFDNWSIRTFRNWNCSACNGRPPVSCVFSRFVYDYWSPNGPVAVPINGTDDGNSTTIDVDPLCPGHLNVSLSVAERTFWLNRCPSLATATADRPLCSAWLNASDLTVLYYNASTVAADAGVAGNESARTTVTYGISSHYAWLSLPGGEAAGNIDDGRLAPVICASCVSWHQEVPCVAPSTSEATLCGGVNGDDGNENDTLTIGGVTYQKPFFVKRSAACSVVICSEWDPNALAALSASSRRFGDRSAFRSIAAAIALRAAARLSFLQW